MRNTPGNAPVKKQIITIVILAVILFLLGLFETHPQAVERYYSQSLYLGMCRIVHPFFNIIPFSVGDILYLAVMSLFIWYIIKLIRLAFKKRWQAAGTLALSIVIGFQATVLAFYILWGLNYYRPSAAERLNLPDSNYTTRQLTELTRLVIDSANATRARVTPADLHQSNSTIELTAVKAVLAMSGQSQNFRTFSPKVKLSLFTPLISLLGTSGYYNPFTTESQMNYEMPVFIKPFVACHEMSHQMGYGPEDEANFVGFLAGIKSNDRLLRYSAWHEAVDECMRDLMFRDTVLHAKMKLLVSAPVHADFVAERDFWLAHENKLNIISDIFYDNFLKANNQPQGLLTYNRMLRLVMAMYNKKELGNK